MIMHRRTSRSAQGFTLVELMIVMVILAIVAVVALPAYQAQTQKARRADAKATLMDLAQRQERFHSERGSYARMDVIAGADPFVTQERFYSLAVACFDIAANPVVCSTAA